MHKQANHQPMVRTLSRTGQRQHFSLSRPYRRGLLTLTFVGVFLVITMLFAFMPVANAMSKREYKINQRSAGLIEVVVQQPVRPTSTPTPTSTPMPTSVSTPITETIEVDQESIPTKIFSEKTFKLSGTAKGNAEVQITKDDATKSLVGHGYADAAGKWVIDVKVTDEGTYKLEAKELVDGTTDTVTIAVVANPPTTPTPTD